MVITHLPLMIACTAGPEAARPEVAARDMLYYATDTGLLTRGDGSAWELIGMDTLNARIVSGEIPITLAMPTAPAAPDPPAARNAPRERA